MSRTTNVPTRTFIKSNCAYKLQESLVDDAMIIEKLSLMKRDFIMFPNIIHENLLKTLFSNEKPSSFTTAGKFTDQL